MSSGHTKPGFVWPLVPVCNWLADHLVPQQRFHEPIKLAPHLDATEDKLSRPMSRPNIVLFMVDQLAARWVTAALSGACPVPNIDRLRARGTTFSRCFSSNPVCSPARATLATGLTSRGHGVLQNGYDLDPELPTFMRQLQKAGWRTGAFGKLHFLPHFCGTHVDYKPYGFDVVHNTEDGRAGEWLDWIAREYPQYLEAVLATHWDRAIPEFEVYGPHGINLREQISRARDTFQWATPDFPGNTAAAYTLPFPCELSQTEWITRHALDFVTERSPDKPWFAHISYVQPHSPMCPPEEFMETVNEARIPAPLSITWRDDPHAPLCFRSARTVDSDLWR